MKLGITRESRTLTRGTTVGACPCLGGYEDPRYARERGLPSLMPGEAAVEGYIGPHMDPDQAVVGADIVTSASNTTMDVIKVLGVGFLGYLALKHVVPMFIGAASETKKKRHEYDMIDRHERERREDRDTKWLEERIDRRDAREERKAQRGTYFNDTTIHDAEFVSDKNQGLKVRTLRSGERPYY